MNRLQTLFPAAALALGLACGACKSDPDAESHESAAPPTAEPAPVAIEEASLPLDVLARLALAGDRELGPACASARDAVTGAAAAAASARDSLAAGADTATGPATLDALATALGDRANRLEVTDDDSELARTRRELAAAIRDLAEATTSLAVALRDRAGDAAGGARLRLDNGVDNLGATLDRLELLCDA